MLSKMVRVQRGTKKFENQIAYELFVLLKVNPIYWLESQITFWGLLQSFTILVRNIHYYSYWEEGLPSGTSLKTYLRVL